MKKENLVNEAELRNLIRRRILSQELGSLNEAASMTVASALTSLAGISLGGIPGVSGGIVNTTAIAILSSVGGFLRGLSGTSGLLTTSSVGLLLSHLVGLPPGAGIAAGAMVGTHLGSVRLWINSTLGSLRASQSDNEFNKIQETFRNNQYFKFAKDFETDIQAGGDFSVPGVIRNADGSTSFLTDSSGNIINGFLGIAAADFTLPDPRSQAATDSATNIKSNLSPPPSTISNVTNFLDANLAKNDLALSEYEGINTYIFDARSTIGPMAGGSGIDRYMVTTAQIEGVATPSSRPNSSIIAQYASNIDIGTFGATPLFPQVGDFNREIGNAGIVDAIEGKDKNSIFKIEKAVPGFNEAVTSAAIYDASNSGHFIDVAGDLHIGRKFFSAAMLGVIAQNIKDLGSELLRLAKAAGVFLVSNYPDLLKDDEGVIQAQLDALSTVLANPASGAIECTVSVLTTLLIIAQVAGTKAFDKVVDFGEDIVDFFTGEENNETTTTTTSGRTTSATTRSTTAGTRSNTERIQTLLNQYWAREGLTSPVTELEVDGKWGDLTDYMWFAVLEHASDNNSWYSTTTTSAGKDNAGWPATAASLREADGESFDGKTTGCIQFLEKLLGSETEAGTPSIDTPSGGGNTGDLGTTTQQQSRGEATGMQGLIKVVGTGMTDVMYLEDIGYSEGTSESLARDIINAADRGYTGSGEPLNFTVEIFKNSNSGEYRKVKVKRAKGENRRDLRGLEKIPGVIKNFLEKKKPDFGDDNFQNTMRKERRATEIYEFNLAITVPG